MTMHADYEGLELSHGHIVFTPLLALLKPS
jgi:hypothetical protein